MRNPAPAPLHFCYGMIVLIWGPGEGLPSCPWSLGIEYSGHQLKEGRGEDHSSSWGKGGIRSWAHSGRREGGRITWRTILQEARDEVQGSGLIRNLRSVPNQDSREGTFLLPSSPPP